MILDQLAVATKKRIQEDKEKIPLKKMKQMAENITGKKPFCFEEALKQPNIHFICEVKRASPSKGMIAKEFPYVKIAKEYEEAGATCISVLTEPTYFMGSDEYLREIAKEVSIPVLRKDFTLEEYQLYQAKVLGANAVLLICSLLSEEEIKKYIKICDALSLSALVETHNETEIKMAINAGARVLGVNNRNLKTFEVDVHLSERLRKLIPDSILFVAESGITTKEDVNILKKANVNGVLIGETLMKCEDKKQMLIKLGGLVDEN